VRRNDDDFLKKVVVVVIVSMEARQDILHVQYSTNAQVPKEHHLCLLMSALGHYF
jgi:hypothetical protein